jgi:uncharacterized protein YjdB
MIKINRKEIKYQKGQTLILLLVFIVVAIAITTAAVVAISTNSESTTNTSMGVITKQMAESGIEQALLKYLRNPSYTGETFTLDTGSVTVTVSGNGNITIDSVAVNGNFTKKVEVSAIYSNNILTVGSWKDIN